MTDLSAQDWEGTPVRCRSNTWNDHIIEEHPELIGQEAAVCTTVRDPVYVYQSGRYPRRRLLYRPFILPRPFDRSYLLVVVEYKGDGKRKRGDIYTAFATANIKLGDYLIWSKYKQTTT